MPIISIAADHFPVARKQIFQLYDTFKKYTLLSPVKKSFFLNSCAIGFGYRHWDDFQRSTLSGHKDCNNRLIFTPGTIKPIAKLMRLEFGTEDASVDLIISCIANVLSEDETIAFIGYELPTLPLSTPIFIDLELGPDTYHEQCLLEYLWPHFNSSLEEGVIDYLDFTKRMRKAYSKEKILTKGWDVTAKRGITAISLFEGLIKQGYLVEQQDKLSISNKGDWLCRSMFTNEFDEVWQDWFKSFKTLFKKVPHKIISDDWTRYITLYKEGCPPEKAIGFCAWSALDIKAEKAIKNSLSTLGFSKENTLLHIHPTLYLANKDFKIKAKDVILKISSPELDLGDLSFKLNKPFPNKSYIGASSSKETNGIYIPIPSNLDVVDIKMEWLLPTGTRILHTLNIELIGTREEADHIYSTVIQSHNGGAAPVLLKPCAIYALHEYFRPNKGEPLQGAANRHERIKCQITKLTQNKDALTIFDERLTLDYLPFLDGWSLIT
jgi:hypothetical protein